MKSINTRVLYIALILMLMLVNAYAQESGFINGVVTTTSTSSLNFTISTLEQEKDYESTFRALVTGPAGSTATAYIIYKDADGNTNPEWSFQKDFVLNGQWQEITHSASTPGETSLRYAILKIENPNLNTVLKWDQIEFNSAPISVLSFATNTSSGLESAPRTDIQINLSTPSAVDITVDYEVTGTATGGAIDHTLDNGSLTISAGQTIGNISLTGIVDDLLDEPDETIIVTLTNAVSATLGNDTEHIYTIMDDDATSINFNSPLVESVQPNETYNINDLFTNYIRFFELPPWIDEVSTSVVSGPITVDHINADSMHLMTLNLDESIASNFDPDQNGNYQYQLSISIKEGAEESVFLVTGTLSPPLRDEFNQLISNPPPLSIVVKQNGQTIANLTNQEEFKIQLVDSYLSDDEPFDIPIEFILTNNGQGRIEFKTDYFKLFLNDGRNASTTQFGINYNWLSPELQNEFIYIDPFESKTIRAALSVRPQEVKQKGGVEEDDDEDNRDVVDLGGGSFILTIYYQGVWYRITYIVTHDEITVQDEFYEIPALEVETSITEVDLGEEEEEEVSEGCIDGAPEFVATIKGKRVENGGRRKINLMECDNETCYVSVKLTHCQGSQESVEIFGVGYSDGETDPIFKPLNAPRRNLPAGGTYSFNMAIDKAAMEQSTSYSTEVEIRNSAEDFSFELEVFSNSGEMSGQLTISSPDIEFKPEGAMMTLVETRDVNFKNDGGLDINLDLSGDVDLPIGTISSNSSATGLDAVFSPRNNEVTLAPGIEVLLGTITTSFDPTVENAYSGEAIARLKIRDREANDYEDELPIQVLCDGNYEFTKGNGSVIQVEELTHVDYGVGAFEKRQASLKINALTDAITISQVYLVSDNQLPNNDLVTLLNPENIVGLTIEPGQSGTINLEFDATSIDDQEIKGHLVIEHDKEECFLLKDVIVVAQVGACSSDCENWEVAFEGYSSGEVLEIDRNNYSDDIFEINVVPNNESGSTISIIDAAGTADLILGDGINGNLVVGMATASTCDNGPCKIEIPDGSTQPIATLSIDFSSLPEGEEGDFSARVEFTNTNGIKRSAGISGKVIRRSGSMSIFDKNDQEVLSGVEHTLTLTRQDESVLPFFILNTSDVSFEINDLIQTENAGGNDVISVGEQPVQGAIEPGASASFLLAVNEQLMEPGIAYEATLTVPNTSNNYTPEFTTVISVTKEANAANFGLSARHAVQDDAFTEYLDLNALGSSESRYILSGFNKNAQPIKFGFKLQNLEDEPLELCGFRVAREDIQIDQGQFVDGAQWVWEDQQVLNLDCSGTNNLVQPGEEFIFEGSMHFNQNFIPNFLDILLFFEYFDASTNENVYYGVKILSESSHWTTFVTQNDQTIPAEGVSVFRSEDIGQPSITELELKIDNPGLSPVYIDQDNEFENNVTTEVIKGLEGVSFFATIIGECIEPSPENCNSSAANYAAIARPGKVSTIGHYNIEVQPDAHFGTFKVRVNVEDSNGFTASYILNGTVAREDDNAYSISIRFTENEINKEIIFNETVADIGDLFLDPSIVDIREVEVLVTNNTEQQLPIDAESFEFVTNPPSIFPEGTFVRMGSHELDPIFSAFIAPGQTIVYKVEIGSTGSGYIQSSPVNFGLNFSPSSTIYTTKRFVVSSRLISLCDEFPPNPDRLYFCSGLVLIDKSGNSGIDSRQIINGERVNFSQPEDGAVEFYNIELHNIGLTPFNITGPVRVVRCNNETSPISIQEQPELSELSGNELTTLILKSDPNLMEADESIIKIEIPTDAQNSINGIFSFDVVLNKSLLSLTTLTAIGTNPEIPRSEYERNELMDLGGVNGKVPYYFGVIFENENDFPVWLSDFLPEPSADIHDFVLINWLPSESSDPNSEEFHKVEPNQSYMLLGKMEFTAGTPLGAFDITLHYNAGSNGNDPTEGEVTKSIQIKGKIQEDPKFDFRLVGKYGVAEIPLCDESNQESCSLVLSYGEDGLLFSSGSSTEEVYIDILTPVDSDVNVWIRFTEIENEGVPFNFLSVDGEPVSDNLPAPSGDIVDSFVLHPEDTRVSMVFRTDPKNISDFLAFIQANYNLELVSSEGDVLADLPIKVSILRTTPLLGFKQKSYTHPYVSASNPVGYSFLKPNETINIPLKMYVDESAQVTDFFFLKNLSFSPLDIPFIPSGKLWKTLEKTEQGALQALWNSMNLSGTNDQNTEIAITRMYLENCGLIKLYPDRCDLGSGATPLLSLLSVISSLPFRLEYGVDGNPAPGTYNHRLVIEYTNGWTQQDIGYQPFYSATGSSFTSYVNFEVEVVPFDGTTAKSFIELTSENKGGPVPVIGAGEIVNSSELTIPAGSIYNFQLSNLGDVGVAPNLEASFTIEGFLDGNSTSDDGGWKLNSNTANVSPETPVNFSITNENANCTNPSSVGVFKMTSNDPVRPEFTFAMSCYEPSENLSDIYITQGSIPIEYEHYSSGYQFITEQGVPVRKPFRVHNNGNTVYELTNLKSSEDFRTNALANPNFSLTIPPGEYGKFWVEFLALESGITSGQVTFENARSTGETFVFNVEGFVGHQRDISSKLRVGGGDEIGYDSGFTLGDNSDGKRPAVPIRFDVDVDSEQLQISNVVVNGPFDVRDVPSSIESGENDKFILFLNTTELGKFAGRVTFDHNATTFNGQPAPNPFTFRFNATNTLKALSDIIQVELDGVTMDVDEIVDFGTIGQEYGETLQKRIKVNNLSTTETITISNAIVDESLDGIFTTSTSNLGSIPAEGFVEFDLFALRDILGSTSGNLMLSTSGYVDVIHPVMAEFVPGDALSGKIQVREVSSNGLVNHQGTFEFGATQQNTSSDLIKTFEVINTSEFERDISISKAGGDAGFWLNGANPEGVIELHNIPGSGGAKTFSINMNRNNISANQTASFQLDDMRNTIDNYQFNVSGSVTEPDALESLITLRQVMLGADPVISPNGTAQLGSHNQDVTLNFKQKFALENNSGETIKIKATKSSGHGAFLVVNSVSTPINTGIEITNGNTIEFEISMNLNNIFTDQSAAFVIEDANNPNRSGINFSTKGTVHRPTGIIEVREVSSNTTVHDDVAYSFGNAEQATGANNLVKTFEVRNLTTSALNLSIEESDATDAFWMNSSSLFVSGSGTKTFTISFNLDNTGSHSESFAFKDTGNGNLNIFDVLVAGTVVAPTGLESLVTLRQVVSGTNPIIPVTGTAQLGSHNQDVNINFKQTFSIENNSGQAMIIKATKLSGHGAFTLISNTGSPIGSGINVSNGGVVTFEIALNLNNILTNQSATFKLEDANNTSRGGYSFSTRATVHAPTGIIEVREVSSNAAIHDDVTYNFGSAEQASGANNLIKTFEVKNLTTSALNLSIEESDANDAFWANSSSLFVSGSGTKTFTISFNLDNIGSHSDAFAIMDTGNGNLNIFDVLVAGTVIAPTGLESLVTLRQVVSGTNPVIPVTGTAQFGSHNQDVNTNFKQTFSIENNSGQAMTIKATKLSGHGAFTLISNGGSPIGSGINVSNGGTVSFEVALNLNNVLSNQSATFKLEDANNSSRGGYSFSTRATVHAPTGLIEVREVSSNISVNDGVSFSFGSTEQASGANNLVKTFEVKNLTSSALNLSVVEGDANDAFWSNSSSLFVSGSGTKTFTISLNLDNTGSHSESFAFRDTGNGNLNIFDVLVTGTVVVPVDLNSFIRLKQVILDPNIANPTITDGGTASVGTHEQTTAIDAFQRFRVFNDGQPGDPNFYISITKTGGSTAFSIYDDAQIIAGIAPGTYKEFTIKLNLNNTNNNYWADFRLSDINSSDRPGFDFRTIGAVVSPPDLNTIIRIAESITVTEVLDGGTYDLGDVSQDTNNDLITNFRVFNISSNPISLSIGEADQNDAFWVKNGLSVLDIPANNSRTFDVQMNLNNTGTHSDVLMFGDNGSSRPGFDFVVKGKVVASAQARTSSTILDNLDETLLSGDTLLGGQQEAKMLEIFPNPVVDNMNIVFNSLEDDQVEIVIYDISGEELFRNTWAVTTGINKKILPLVKFKSGVYLLTIQGEEGSIYSRKWFK